MTDETPTMVECPMCGEAMPTPRAMDVHLYLEHQPSYTREAFAAALFARQAPAELEKTNGRLRMKLVGAVKENARARSACMDLQEAAETAKEDQDQARSAALYWAAEHVLRAMDDPDATDRGDAPAGEVPHGLVAAPEPEAAPATGVAYTTGREVHEILVPPGAQVRLENGALVVSHGAIGAIVQTRGLHLRVQ